MNYHTRLKLRRARAAAESERTSDYVRIDADQIMQKYEEAYITANKEKPSLRYRKGWYNVNGTNYRRSEMVRMTGNLLARVHEQEIDDAELRS